MKLIWYIFIIIPVFSPAVCTFDSFTLYSTLEINDKNIGKH